MIELVITEITILYLTQSTVSVGIVVDNGVEVLVRTLVIDGDTGDYISKEYTTIIHTIVAVVANGVIDVVEIEGSAITKGNLKITVKSIFTCSTVN